MMNQSAAIPIQLTKQGHQIITDSQLEIFDQAGHCPHDEHPEKFNHLAIRFLSE